ncbi:MAG: hypothetical protein ACLFUW_00190 [Bacteroidales bacterium]
MKPQKVYLTIKQFIEEYRQTGWITYGSIRYLYRNKPEFNSAFKKIGKRILIDVNEFWDVVDRHEKM